MAPKSKKGSSDIKEEFYNPTQVEGQKKGSPITKNFNTRFKVQKEKEKIIKQKSEESKKRKQVRESQEDQRIGRITNIVEELNQLIKQIDSVLSKDPLDLKGFKKLKNDISNCVDTLTGIESVDNSKSIMTWASECLGNFKNLFKELSNNNRMISEAPEQQMELNKNISHLKALMNLNYENLSKSKIEDLAQAILAGQAEINKIFNTNSLNNSSVVSSIFTANQQAGNFLSEIVKIESSKDIKPDKNKIGKCLEVHFLDVGQGDSTFIVLPDDNQTTILVDCGSKQNSDIGIRNVKACINQVNPKEKSIDYLVLTHGDSDHYNMVNNLYADEYTFENIYVGGKLEDYDGINHLNPKPQVLVDFLNTLDGKNNKNLLGSNNDFVWVLSANMATTTGLKSPSRKNQDSICLRIAWKIGNSINYVYLMGDAEKPVEEHIINRVFDNKTQNTDGGVCVIKLGHHGSKAGTSKEWVKHTAPDLITVSAGSKWEHPYHEPIGRALNIKDEILETLQSFEELKNAYLDDYNTLNGKDKHPWIANNFLSKKESLFTYQCYENGFPVYTNIQKVEYNNDKTFTATGSSYALYIYENGKWEINPYGE